VLPDLRAVQVEDSFEMTACEVLYFGKNFDLGQTVIPPNFRATRLLPAMVRLFAAKASVLEVPEPLWVRFFPVTAALVISWRVGGLLTGRSRSVVTYAIENNSLSNLVAGNSRRSRRLRWLITPAKLVFRVFISRFITRIAFGSEGAEGLYRSLGFSERVEARLFVEVPSRKGLSDEAMRPAIAPLGVVFVGRLEPRKGVLALMRAWPEVEERFPEAVLSIVGNGPLSEAVSEWCFGRPASRRPLGLLEHGAVGDVIASHAVLLAPSIPWGRWREQIGRQIGEGLREGLTVVTTSETGIAGWLLAHGHTVLETRELESGLGRALIHALLQPLDRQSVRQSLAETTPRIEADRWLHSAP